MSDAIITAYGSGGYQTFLDAEAVTTTAGQLNTLRQRVQISVRDITTGTPTEVGDAASQAIRVCVVGGALSATVNNVSITALGPNFPVVTVTGNLTTTPTPNVTVTQWTVPQAVTITGIVTQGTNPWIVGGTVTATGVTIQQATVTQGTLPWTVTYSQGTQAVTYSAGTQPVTVSGVAVVTYSQGTQSVTFSSGTQTVTFTAGTQTVTFSAGTQAITATQLLVSATQGTNPWVVTYSQGTQVVSLSTASPWAVTVSGVAVVTFSGGTQVVSLTTATPWPITLTNPTVAFAPGQVVSVTQATIPWTVTYSAGTQAVTFTAAVVTFSGAQPVTQSNAPWLFAQLDEQGNRTQDSEIRTVLQEMLTELRSIRLGWEYLVASMEDAKTSVPSLREQAEEQQDEGVTN